MGFMGGPSSNSTCGCNIAMGCCEMYSATAGTHNTIIGNHAGYCAKSSNNVFLGAHAGYGNQQITGGENIGIGNKAFSYDTGGNVTGDNNISIGSESMKNPTSATENVAIGRYAGAGLTDGNFNVMIGSSAGSSQTTGCANVYIGRDTPENDTTSNEVIIYNGSNYARFQGSDTSWAFTSDGRDKTNVQDLLLGLSFINTLKPRQFEWDWREDNKAGNGTIRSGFIAQEILEATDAAGLSRTADESVTSKNVYTGLVDVTNPDQYQVSTGELVPMLVKAVQELSAKNDALEARIAALESG